MNQDSHLIFEQYDDVVKSVGNTQPVQQKNKIRVITQWNREDLDKCQVHIQGFGILTLGQLKENVASKFEDLAKRVKNNEPDFAYKRMYEKFGALKRFVEALVLAEKDIEHMRRAGKLPGIAKRSF